MTGRESKSGLNGSYNAVDASNEGIVAEGSSEVKECLWAVIPYLEGAAARGRPKTGHNGRPKSVVPKNEAIPSASMFCLILGFPICSYLDDEYGYSRQQKDVYPAVLLQHES